MQNHNLQVASFSHLQLSLTLKCTIKKPAQCATSGLIVLESSFSQRTHLTHQFTKPTQQFIKLDEGGKGNLERYIKAAIYKGK